MAANDTDDPEVLFAQLLATRGHPSEDEVRALCGRHPNAREEILAMYKDWLDFEHVAGLAGPASGVKRIVFGPFSSLGSYAGGYSPSVLEAFLARLARRRSQESHIRAVHEIARGGMGVVDLARDDVLRRTVARKRVRPESEGAMDQAIEIRRSGRLVEEAQITAQLDHPGIVPVHELSVDDAGVPWFSMKLVVGETLEDLQSELGEAERASALPGRLNTLLKITQALAYAHDKGVVHRDLKPSNIMVGRYGEAYVMDWGLARLVQGDRESQSVEGQHAHEALRSDLRVNEVSSEVTLDGEVMGTPVFMSPEQAQGELALISPRTDIYAVGAILYWLLVGRSPYADVLEERGPIEVLGAIKSSAPQSVLSLMPRSNRELVSICEKAMARDPTDRYPSMSALESDLGAFLEGRVIESLKQGHWVALRKWVARNRALAGATLAAAMLLLGGTIVSLWFARSANRERENVFLLSTNTERLALEDEAEDLWPPFPSQLEPLQSWANRANALHAGLWTGTGGSDMGHVDRLSEIRLRAVEPKGDWLDQHRRAHELSDSLSNAIAARERGEGDIFTIRALRAKVDLHASFRFPDLNDQWWHDQLVELIGGIFALHHERQGLAVAVDTIPGDGWSISQRIELAEQLKEAMMPGGEYEAAWAQASSAVASDPRYSGVALEPQQGLLPIGMDPESGLLEFCDMLSGSAPVRGEDGQLLLAEDSAIVFVLIPGATTRIGAQSDSTSDSHFDEWSVAEYEQPPSAASIDSFFLSKYEVTQAQWSRCLGENPSKFLSGNSFGDLVISGMHPVEQVPLDQCARFVSHLGMRLPSEIEWEYAARAGTTTVFVTGVDESSLLGSANVADQFLERISGSKPGWSYADFDDGFGGTAPVGSLLPNKFGLHDVSGNVWEWCLPMEPLDGRRSLENEDILRGGSWTLPPVWSRVAHRWRVAPGFARHEAGLRPARSLD